MFATTRVRAAAPFQKSKAIPTTASPKSIPTTPLKRPPQTPLLSYAQQLANKPVPTTLYETGPQGVFLCSSYIAGLVSFGAAGINIWFNVYNVPEGIHWVAPVAFGIMGVIMAAIGTRFALMPAGAIRSIKVLPARPGKAPVSIAKSATLENIPVRLEVEVRRNFPIPGSTIRRFQVNPDKVVMKAPMYNRPPATSEYDSVLQKQQEEARRKQARQYDMDHLMTAPFRHGFQAFSMLFANFRRGLTGEGFAPVTIDETNYKLDITSAYALEDGRALDRIVRIEEDPGLSRLFYK